MSSPVGFYNGVLNALEANVDNVNVNGNTITATNSGGDLILASNGSGGVIVDPGTTGGFSVSDTRAGGVVINRVTNSDTGNTASDSQLNAITNGAGAGDPYLNCGIVAVRSWAWGVDNSDSDSLKESTDAGTASPSAGTVTRKVTSAGIQTLPLQPSFFAYVNANIVNTTGNGTQYVIAANWTEISDAGSNFNAATGVFTAPATGMYQADAAINMGNLAGATSVNYQFLSDGTSWYFHESIIAATPASGRFAATGSTKAYMVAGDTMALRVQAQGAVGDTLTVIGGAAPYFTYFGMTLLT